MSDLIRASGIFSILSPIVWQDRIFHEKLQM